MINANPHRRSALMLVVAAVLSPNSTGVTAEQAPITIHKDPNCGCCTGWVRHLEKNGFATNVDETSQIWPAPGSEDTELGILMEPEMGHGKVKICAGIQA